MVDESKPMTMALPVKLTDAHVSIRSQELATAEGRLVEAETALTRQVLAAKSAKEDCTEAVSDARHEVRRLGEIVRNRREDRPVVVMLDYDYPGGVVNTVRTDSGEIVATRSITPEERQRGMFPQPVEASKKPS